MISLSQQLLDSMAAQAAAAFDGGRIRVFAGARPPDASHPEPSDMLLGEFTDNASALGLAFVAAGGFVQVRPGVRMLMRAVASGTAAWFRVVAAADTGTASFSEPRIDGDIGSFAAPGDMAWRDTAVAAGGLYTLDTFYYLIHPMGSTP